MIASALRMEGAASLAARARKTKTDRGSPLLPESLPFTDLSVALDHRLLSQLNGKRPLRGSGWVPEVPLGQVVRLAAGRDRKCPAGICPVNGRSSMPGRRRWIRSTSTMGRGFVLAYGAGHGGQVERA